MMTSTATGPERNIWLLNIQGDESLSWYKHTAGTILDKRWYYRLFWTQALLREIVFRPEENGRPTNSRNTAPYRSACHFLQVGDLFSTEQVEYNKQTAFFEFAFVIFNHKYHKETCSSARNPKQGFAQPETNWHRKRCYISSKTKPFSIENEAIFHLKIASFWVLFHILFDAVSYSFSLRARVHYILYTHKDCACRWARSRKNELLPEKYCKEFLMRW